MRTFLLAAFGALVGLTLFIVLAPIALIGWAGVAARPPAAAADSVLVLDLRHKLNDQTAGDGLAAFTRPPPSVMDIEKALDRGAADGRIKGLFVRLPDGGVAPAAAEELRAAFLRFRAAKKPIVVFSQGFYAQGPVASTYALAASADEIWMQAGAPFQVTGLSRPTLFMKRAFDHYGVKPEFEQRREYKTAVNGYLQSDYTPAHRESELSWMGAVWTRHIATIAQDRRFDPTALRALLEKGPMLSQTAVTARLIDHVGALAEAEAAIKRRAGGGAHLTPLENYAAEPVFDGVGNAVAVIPMEGMILNGSKTSAPLGQGPAIASDEAAERIETAVKDSSVKAIVIRLSSPGGSDTASEEIRAALMAARQAGKPVVVSMGAYGASGGYWLATGADQIIAEPTTLTGSIGVFGGKFAYGEALSRFGIDMRQVHVGGEFSDAFSPATPWTPAQHAAFVDWMDAIYAAFIDKVSTARRLPRERVAEIAKGRVWTGAQALDLGLVDGLGDLREALARARKLAKLPADAPAKLFPVKAGLFDGLGGLMGESRIAATPLTAGDPFLEQVNSEITRARLRAAGAMVLATTPDW